MNLEAADFTFDGFSSTSSLPPLETFVPSAFPLRRVDEFMILKYLLYCVAPTSPIFSQLAHNQTPMFTKQQDWR
jgi:hypothetical protein